MKKKSLPGETSLILWDLGPICTMKQRGDTGGFMFDPLSRPSVIRNGGGEETLSLQTEAANEQFSSGRCSLVVPKLLGGTRLIQQGKPEAWRGLAFSEKTDSVTMPPHVGKNRRSAASILARGFPKSAAIKKISALLMKFGSVEALYPLGEKDAREAFNGDVLAVFKSDASARKVLDRKLVRFENKVIHFRQVKEDFGDLIARHLPRRKTQFARGSKGSQNFRNHKEQSKDKSPLVDHPSSESGESEGLLRNTKKSSDENPPVEDFYHKVSTSKSILDIPGPSNRQYILSRPFLKQPKVELKQSRLNPSKNT